MRPPADCATIPGMEAVRETRPIWLLMRMERDEFGQDDDCAEVGMFWERAPAVEERDRLTKLNDAPAVHYEIVRATTTIVYPDDESPPWVPDPERWKKRGYEQPPEDA